MKLYNVYSNISPEKAAEMEQRALADKEYLRSLVVNGWHLSLPLQLKLFDLDSCRTIESYIKKYQLDAPAEILLFELEDSDLLKEYIDRYATSLGKTMLSQAFILKLFDLPTGRRHLEHCLRKRVWLSPKAQVRMLKEDYGQDLLLRYLVPYSKYARWQEENKKEEIPLCRSAQMLLLKQPNAREIIWFLAQTWKLCPRAEHAARSKGWI